ncbi:hypothetical protein D3C86_965290 [compost metagenome]
MRVDGVVVAVQEVETGLDAWLDQAETRKVVAALDTVVAVQMLKEGLQGRHEGGVQAARVQRAGPPAGRSIGHLNLLSAEASVHLQPEGGGFGQGSGPAFTRECVAQIKHIVGQTGANAQGVRVVVRIRRQRSCSG